jgi:hypothetical protein
MPYPTECPNPSCKAPLVHRTEMVWRTVIEPDGNTAAHPLCPDCNKVVPALQEACTGKVPVSDLGDLVRCSGIKNHAGPCYRAGGKTT